MTFAYESMLLTRFLGALLTVMNFYDYFLQF